MTTYIESLVAVLDRPGPPGAAPRGSRDDGGGPPRGDLPPRPRARRARRAAATLLGGGVVVLQDHYEPVATLAAIERERVTDLFLVEPLAERAVALLPAPHRAGQAEPTRPSAR